MTNFYRLNFGFKNGHKGASLTIEEPQLNKFKLVKHERIKRQKKKSHRKRKQVIIQPYNIII